MAWVCKCDRCGLIIKSIPFKVSLTSGLNHEMTFDFDLCPFCAKEVLGWNTDAMKVIERRMPNEN